MNYFFTFFLKHFNQLLIHYFVLFPDRILIFNIVNGWLNNDGIVSWFLYFALWFHLTLNHIYDGQRDAIIKGRWKSWRLVLLKRLKPLLMAMRTIVILAVSTVLSFVGLQFCAEFSLDKLKSEILPHWNNGSHVSELLLGSYTTIGLLANFMINVFILLNLCIKVCLLYWTRIIVY